MVDVIGAPTLAEQDQWDDEVVELQNGWRPTGGPPNPAADEGILNWPLQALANRTRWLKARHDEQKMAASLTLTVGAAGQYPTVMAALERISLMRPKVQTGLVKATIKILAGHTWSEQVIVRGLDLGWIEIVSEDAVVPLKRSALVVQVGTVYPAISGEGARLPKLSCRLAMDATGVATDRCGLALMSGSSIVVSSGAGVTGSGGYGAVIQGSTLSAEGANFSGAALDGVRVTRSGGASLQGANLSNCGQRGIYAERSSSVDAQAVNCQGCTLGGAAAYYLARVDVANGQMRKGATDGATDMVVLGGGMILALGATGGANIAVNTLVASGIIFR